ncbi:MAG TPA: tRNA lysidine(34) synthetase TilS [Myxococcota bacterium]|nr:tRNA lysidine(34) synthetase TilS [Myxococcota bacterium]HRY93928.1 tRNA lysidine(34) synthetase TilS [Myxococcota bacterium]HSA23388.1 tRNA lysidine(34) synthetase TilS [Myxococcota bacterium]
MSARVDLLARVRRALLTDGLVPPGGEVLVACSGGADSTALLDLLDRLRAPLALRLEVASVDHGQRPDSGRIAGAVGELARARGLAFHRLRLSPRSAFAGASETALRAARLAILARLARRRGLAHVALGHTADDQVETVLLRLARGTGVAGLAGIRARGPAPFVHPLLGLTRREIEAYLAWRGLGWREDPANQDLRHARNRVRHGLLPWLRAELNPSISRAVLRLARAAARDEECLSAQADQPAIEQVGAGVEIDAACLRALPPALQARVLLRLLAALRGQAARLEAEQLEALLARLARPGRRWRLGLPGGLALRCAQGRIRLEEDAPGSP